MAPTSAVGSSPQLLKLSAESAMGRGRRDPNSQQRVMIQTDPNSHQNKESNLEPSSSSSSQQQNLNPSTTNSIPKTSRNRRKSRGNNRNKLPLLIQTPDSESSSSSSHLPNEPEENENENGAGDVRVSTAEFHGEKENGVEEVDDDVVSRLKKLILVEDEVEISEVQFSINNQLQEDELLAMEAIYGDNLTILESEGGRRYFQIDIHVETPEEYTVSAYLNQNVKPGVKSTSEIASSDQSNEYRYTFKVRHLSPIVLTCSLPKSYPSHQPPYFTISTRWLDSLRVTNLCHMLDSIWADQPGQEVVYQWVEWLHSSSPYHLGIENELILGPYNTSDAVDKRAFSGLVSPDMDIPSMMNYNDEKCHEVFLENLHDCCICLSEHAGTEFVRLPCKHFFCWKCMDTYSNMHVKEGTVNRLLCPDTKCGGVFPPGLLKRLLGNEEFERWESLLLQRTLDSMADVVYCPRCETACLEDADHHGQCSKCFFSFCSLCSEKRHLGVSCMSPETKLQILKDRQGSSNLRDDQRRKEKEMIQEILSVREMLKDGKQCPTCKMMISKTEGCNKMRCTNCLKYFCYKCSQPIDGYDHFSNDGCALFPREEIQQWEQRMNGRQMVGQIEAQLYPERGHPCPLCRQPNVKVGNNNHILCWSCQTHYCYLCRKAVRRSAQHFGPKSCKQHTPD